jgi:hypothetical protein
MNILVLTRTIKVISPSSAKATADTVVTVFALVPAVEKFIEREL